MKKISILFVIVSFFACNGKKIPQTQPNKGRRTASSSQPTSVKDSIPAKPLKNETLFNVEGNYSLELSDSDCRFDLKLFREKGQLRYTLVTNTRDLTGAAEIELNDKKDGYYLDLKDLEWSENEGSLNDEGEPIEDDIKIPTTVQGVMYKDEITIQNAGNSMNYYVKIGECDLKYIILKRKAQIRR